VLKIPLPKGKAQKIFVGAVAGTVALSVAIAVGGLFMGDDLPAEGISAKPLPAPSEALEADPVSTPDDQPAAPMKAPKQPAMQSVPAIGVKRVLQIDGPLRHGDYVWDDEGVPPGPIVITADLKAETLSVFRGGYEIGVAAILFGATDKPSPTGRFPILQKDADHYSNLYDNAPMPYALRLTQDGVFIHGSEVEWGGATHGCLGVPTAFAKKLFDVVKLGDIVIVTDGKMMDLN